jgi:hypothetical protein
MTFGRRVFNLGTDEHLPDDVRCSSERTAATPGAIGVHLNEAQRRAYSVRLSSIDQHLKMLVNLGVDDPLLDSLQEGIEDLAAASGAPITVPLPPDPVGLLIHILIKLDEIAPKEITAYGALDPGACEYLEPAVAELYQLATDLQRRLATVARLQVPPGT